jgi:hypothetical protein
MDVEDFLHERSGARTGRGRRLARRAVGLVAVVLSVQPVTAQGRVVEGPHTPSSGPGVTVTSTRQSPGADGSLEGAHAQLAAACQCSQNGWPASTDPAAIGVRAFTVPGSSVSLKVKAGDVSTVLLYVASRFHDEVEPLKQSTSAGYSYRTIGSSGVLSNHASGTAVDLNWGDHPQGRTGTFTAAQEAVIRDILLATGGVVRWGGDYRTTVDEMHFEINVPPGDPSLARVAATISADPTPAGGWTSIVSSDLDGDGDDEVGYYRRVDGLMVWYDMTATGELGTRLGSHTLSSTWTSIVSADLDGNGDDEVGYYRTSDGTMAWYPMTATGARGTRLTPTGNTLATGWTQLVGTDLDGDHDDELAFYRNTDGTWVAYEGATNGTLGTRLSGSDLYP